MFDGRFLCWWYVFKFSGLYRPLIFDRADLQISLEVNGDIDDLLEEGAILKREWWRPWKSDHIPNLMHVIQSYDTAFSKRETSDYSAITTWGIFYPEEGSGPNLILLDALRGKYDFPELKAVALDANKYWEPESIIIEQK